MKMETSKVNVELKLSGSVNYICRLVTSYQTSEVFNSITNKAHFVLVPAVSEQLH